jgi:hypothetical protein
VGALVAASIALAISTLAAQLDVVAFRVIGGVRIDPGALPAYSLLGVPIVAWLGWHLAPGAAFGSRRTAVTRALAMAILAVVVGAFFVVLVAVVQEVPGSNVRWPDALIAFPYLLAAPIVGIVLFGPFVFAVTLPASLAWAVGVRLLVDDTYRRAGEPIASIH